MPINSKFAGRTCALGLLAGLWAGPLYAAQTGGAAPTADRATALVGADHRLHRGGQSPDGRPVVEIGTGMNYWDGQQWSPSEAVFDLAADAFLAGRMNYQVRLEANLNSVGSVVVVTPDGTELRSTPVGIGLFDPVTGESLVIAALADCVGVQTADNTVVYENAFAGVCANLVYHIDKATFEQDVVLTGRLDPAAYGFDPKTAQLQVFTEFFGAPEPETVRRPLRVEKDPAVRRLRVQPDLFDEVLGFGQFVLGTGRAFTALSSGESGVAVGKTFGQIEGRTILVETLDFAALRDEFEALPDCKVEGDAAVLQGKRTTGYAGLPKAGSNRQARTVPGTTGPRRDFAQAARTPGVVVDYQASIGGTLSSSTIFRGDTTYFLGSAVICNGSATIEGGAVFKYPTNSTVSLKLTSTVTCRTSPYRPAVFTAADDDTVGDPIDTGIWSGYTGVVKTNGYGNPMVWVYNTSQNLSNLRFRFAQEAVRFEGTANAWALSHSQLANCIRGIVVNGSGSGSGTASLTVNNTVLAGVQYPINLNNASFSGTWNHCTFDTATRLVTATATTTFTARNSVFANIATNSSGSVTLAGNNNGFYAATGFGTTQTSSGSNPFQTVGAGRYYLASGSVFLNAGSTNSNVGAALLAEIKLRTTAPPLLLASAITTSTNLGLQAARDTDLPDLGYHYDPLDYAASGINVTNATLTLGEGVALATYGNVGFRLLGQAQLNTSGSPLLHNHLARYYNVQEQPTNWGGATLGTTISITPTNYGANPPSAQLRFVDFDGLAGGGFHLYTLSNGCSFALLQLKDCTFGSGLAAFDGPSTASLSLSNNLFEWVGTTFRSSAKVDAYNNLFRSGTNSLVNAGGTWTFRDNAFDSSIVAPGGTSIVASNNAYITTNITVSGRFTPTNAADVVLSSFTYASNTLGQFYHSSTTLDDKGSRTADLAGLYHYTCKTTQVKETNSVVDIGFHYVALGTNGLPADLEGDGLPDYLEDANGNGTVDSGETSWLEADSDFDGIGDGEERANGTDPLSAASTTQRLLSSFRFNSTNWIGDQGQVPLSTLALTNEPGVEGSAVPITGAAYSKKLNYRTIEGNGRPNMAFSSGTVCFWFKPNWASTSLGGTGPDPGAWGRLFNLGEWTSGATYGFWDIGLDPGGTQISLTEQDGLGHNSGAPWGYLNLASNTWVHLAVTYSPTYSAVYVNGAIVNGAAWGSLVPPKAIRDGGFFVGSDTSGAQQAQGSYDLLELYNYPMTSSQVASNYVWTVESGQGYGAQLFRPNGKSPVH
jgi:hypothetical protein